MTVFLDSESKKRTVFLAGFLDYWILSRKKSHYLFWLDSWILGFYKPWILRFLLKENCSVFLTGFLDSESKKRHCLFGWIPGFLDPISLGFSKFELSLFLLAPWLLGFSKSELEKWTVYFLAGSLDSWILG